MDGDALAFLSSAPGRRLVAGLSDADLGDEALLSTLERLRREVSGPRAAAVVETARLRRRAEAKFTRANEMLFTRDGLEQASGEVVSRHRVRRFARLGPEAIVDLGCGIGGDALALATVAPVVGVDRDAVTARLALHNVDVYRPAHPFAPVVADIASFAVKAGAGFADPGRRRQGRRRFSVDEYDPPLEVILDRWLPELRGLAVKVSPGIDHTQIPPGAEAEFVSVRGDVRECSLWMGELASGANRRATVLPAGLTLTDEEPVEAVPVTEIGAYLHEPDRAIIRAHLVEGFAVLHGLTKIDPDIAYLTGDAPLATPAARSYAVETVMPFSVKRLRTYLRSRGVGAVTVKKRGSPLSPDELRRHLALVGDAHRVVILTHNRGRPVAVVAEEGARGSRHHPD